MEKLGDLFCKISNRKYFSLGFNCVGYFYLLYTRGPVHRIHAQVGSLSLAGNQGLLGPSCPVPMRAGLARACQTVPPG